MVIQQPGQETNNLKNATTFAILICIRMTYAGIRSQASVAKAVGISINVIGTNVNCVTGIAIHITVGIRVSSTLITASHTGSKGENAQKRQYK